MKLTTTILTLAVATTQVDAAWNSCGFGDYEIVFTSLAQGVGVNSADVSTDCVAKASLLGKQTKKLQDSFSNFETSDWAKPLYELSNLSTSSTSVFTACQTTNFAKQFAVRMNSLGGIFDLISTIGVSFLQEFVTKPGKSELYNAMNGFNIATTCSTAMVSFGTMTKLMWSYEAQP